MIRFGACVLAALSAAAIAAQPIRADELVIRVSSRLVQVNVIVRDKTGPVTGLTKDDFVITDRGKPQTIQELSVEAPGNAAADHRFPRILFRITAVVFPRTRLWSCSTGSTHDSRTRLMPSGS